jgi:uncharacterized glyoxalase superfamily protein PhnB
VVGAPLEVSARADAVLQIGVADVDAAADLLRARGVTLVTVPHDQSSWAMRVCHVHDPAGRLLEMSAPLAAATR